MGFLRDAVAPAFPRRQKIVDGLGALFHDIDELNHALDTAKIPVGIHQSHRGRLPCTITVERTVTDEDIDQLKGMGSVTCLYSLSSSGQEDLLFVLRETDSPAFLIKYEKGAHIGFSELGEAIKQDLEGMLHLNEKFRLGLTLNPPQKPEPAPAQ